MLTVYGMDSEEKDDYVNGSCEDANMHSVPDSPLSGNDAEEQIDDAYAEGQYLDRICEKQVKQPFRGLLSTLFHT